MTLQPQDVACCHQHADLTNCGAAAGEPCRAEDKVPLPAGSFHAERLIAAASASIGDGQPVTDQVFDQAVLATGLF